MLGIDNQDFAFYFFGSRQNSEGFEEIYCIILLLLIGLVVIYFQIYGYLL